MIPDHNDDLRAENAFLKLKLEMDYGMQGGYFSNELTPAMENACLQSILDFEKKFKDGPVTKVFNHLGKPKFKRWDKLEMREVRPETKRLLDLMRRRGVVLESLKPVDDLEYYRFITEELFHQEMMFVPNGNMILHYVYEEFMERGAGGDS